MVTWIGITVHIFLMLKEHNYVCGFVSISFGSPTGYSEILMLTAPGTARYNLEE
jgi:hypothetical protein